MHVAVTGATGFLGRYIVNRLLRDGHQCRCWHRPTSDRGGFVRDARDITWIEGGLHEPQSVEPLLAGVNAVVHAGLYFPPSGSGHRGAATDVVDFARTNIIGTLNLIEAARDGAIDRFVFISTCGVHDVILDDRPLDEAHPLWPLSHYGAYKAAVEKFVHSFGMPHAPAATAAPTHKHLSPKGAWGICALRPAGIFGLRRPVEQSKWSGVVSDVLAGKPVDDASGGKEVHAEDVATAVCLLLAADTDAIGGQSFNCCDTYVAAQDVARIARERTAGRGDIADTNRGPKHSIDTTKIQAIGMKFGGRSRLEKYVEELVEAIRKT